MYDCGLDGTGLSMRGGWLHVRGVEEPLYFRLKGVILSEHMNEHSIALRCINLLNGTVSSRHRRHGIKLKTQTKERLYFYALNKREWVQWILAMRYATRQRDVRDYYTIGKRIGEGAYGTVRKAVRKSSGELVAIKVVDKTKYSVIDKKYVSSEISIIMSVNHPGIIDTYDIFDAEDKLYIVMKYVQGGTLEDHINRIGRIDELKAAQYAGSLLSALACLHSFGIVHRDIKTDNILLCYGAGEDSEGDGPTVQLSDFGLGAMVRNSEVSSPLVLESVIGSWFYIAPEQAKCERYGAAVDMWAAGVLIFRMLSGMYPFVGRGANEVLGSIRKGQFQFGPEFDHVSTTVKGLVRQMLEPDATKRITAIDALRHPWIRRPDGNNTDVTLPRLSSLSSLEEDRIRLHRQLSRDMDLDLNGATVVKGMEFDEDEVESQRGFGWRRTLHALSSKVFPTDFDENAEEGVESLGPRSFRAFGNALSTAKGTFLANSSMGPKRGAKQQNPASPFF